MGKKAVRKPRTRDSDSRGSKRGSRDSGRDRGSKFGAGRKQHSRGGRSASERPGFKPFIKATCHGCGSSCELPFKPSGDQPVYCSACFRKQPKDASRGRGRDSRGSDTKLDRIEKKLDKILKLLED